ncbi:Alpha/Beta hydrolase protein [Aspergillus avenaceus]|uniref:Alpha/Beta hydrolase protein n=1 Tax=Aspergillus avenaceus TaxID=36643 RepID=A0A5N6U161_ASPAV|nr:Alpha/Beta hydrolase protein [Aspergillus avenaceus]
MQTHDIGASSLEVDGASLHYELIGAGPLLLLMPGANGTGFLYQPLAAALSSQFEVVVYDRRGFGQSPILEAEDPDSPTLLRTQTVDASRLIEHLSPGRPVTVFACSGSGVMGIDLLQSRPDLVYQLVLHEPLLIAPLPEPLKSQIIAEYTNTILEYGKYSSSRLHRALMPLMQSKRDQFRLGQTHQFSRLQTLPGDHTGRFYQHELPQIFDYRPDPGILRRYRERIVLTKGAECAPRLSIASVHTLAQALDIPTVIVPGGHTSYVTDVEPFTKHVVSALRCATAKL